MTIQTQTIDQFIASEKATSASQIVAQVNGRGVTRDELSLAFDAVADKANWKNPINTVVDLDDYTKALVAEAVVFYAGCVPSFERLTGTTTSGLAKYRVTAKGYYAAVGA